MKSFRTSIRVGVLSGATVLLVAATLPRTMVGPGEWAVARSADGDGIRVCLADPAMLMQWEHRGKPCERTILNSTIDRAEVQYSCPGGGFGTSRMQVLTPRSIKVDTQGIADGLPFGYALYARRVGDCRPK